MAGVAWSVLAILVCGGLGALAGYGLLQAAGLGGTLGALLAAIVAMVVATVAWAGGSALLRRLGILR